MPFAFSTHNQFKCFTLFIVHPCLSIDVNMLIILSKRIVKKVQTWDCALKKICVFTIHKLWFYNSCPMLQSLMIMQKLLMMIQIMHILWQVGWWTWLKLLCCSVMKIKSDRIYLKHINKYILNTGTITLKSQHWSTNYIVTVNLSANEVKCYELLIKQ